MNDDEEKKVKFMQWVEVMTQKHDHLSAIESENAKDIADLKVVVSSHDETLKDLGKGMAGMVKAQEETNDSLEKIARPFIGLFDFFDGVGRFVNTKAFKGMVIVAALIFGVTQTEILTLLGLI